jgi:hypothetical protein
MGLSAEAPAPDPSGVSVTIIVMISLWWAFTAASQRLLSHEMLATLCP